MSEFNKASTRRLRLPAPATPAPPRPSPAGAEAPKPNVIRELTKPGVQ